mmetsp:Transcript_22691/g.32036  ORF Transcript_22691/g.32036 Transcript_22691/m.32036 type:complete len:290 (-) Transcript_22691:51-920(-)
MSEKKKTHLKFDNPVTLPANLLADPQIKDLLSSCGYNSSDLEQFQQLFCRFADITRLDGSKRCSFQALLKLLQSLGLEVKTDQYATQYFRAFDMDSCGEVDMREFCLGLIVMDPDLPHHPGKQWLRCRLEMIFRFYDLNGNHTLEADEFFHFCRHALREAGKPHDPDSAKSFANTVAAMLPVSKTQSLSVDQFIELVTGGHFARYGMHTTPLLNLPSFRSHVKAAATQTRKVPKPALKKADFAKADKRKAQVKILSGHNEIPVSIDPENRANPCPTNMLAYHAHKKNQI